MNKRLGLLFPALLGALGLFVCRNLWLGHGIVYAPQSDAIESGVGLKSVLARSLREDGRWALWNPSMNSGAPAHASPQSMYDFPLDWAYLFLPIDRANNLAYLLAVLLAGGGMYALGRRLYEYPESAFFAACAYMLCHRALFMIRTGWGSALDAYALTPLMFFSLDRLVERPRARRAVELGAVGALGLCQGFTQGAYYAALAAAAFCVWNLRRAPERRRRFALAGLAAAAVLAVLLSAPDLLPRAEFARLSTRVNASGEFISFKAPTPSDLKTLLDPTQGAGDEPWERSFYFGLWLYPACVFALWKNGRREAPLAAAAGAIALIAWAGPAQRLCVALLPGFSLFRFHARALLLGQFVLTVLAGRGVDAALRDGSANSCRRFALCWAAVAAVGFAAAAAWSSPALAAASCGPAIAAALLAARGRADAAAIALLCLLPLADGWSLAPTTRPLAEIFPEQTFYAGLRRDAQPGRIAVVGRSAIPYGAASYLGIDMINGYSGLNLKSYEDYFAVLQYGNVRAIPRTPLLWTDFTALSRLDLLRGLDTEFIVGSKNLPGLEALGFRPVGRWTDVPVFHFGAGVSPETVYLWKDSRPLGPAYFAESLSSVSSDAESLTALAAGAGGRRAAVFGLARSTDSVGLAGGAARLVRRGENDYSYRVDSRGENYLILSQAWYPGWQAFLDGRETRVYRTNHALIGLFVPPGAHDLELNMTSPSLRLGLALFALGAAAAAALGALPDRFGGSA
jgi:hypothetical protein